MINEKTMINENDPRAGTVAGGPLCMRSNSYDFPATVLGQSEPSLHPDEKAEVRRGQKLAHSHPVRKWQNQEANLGLLLPEPVLGAALLPFCNFRFQSIHTY